MLTAQTRGLLPAVLMLLSVFALGHTSQLLGSSSQNIFLIITAGGSMIKTSLETHLEQHPHSIKLRTSEEGNTPLHVAARHSSPEIVSLLLRRGADVNAKNRKGQTPLDITKVENIKTLMVSGARLSGTESLAKSGNAYYIGDPAPERPGDELKRLGEELKENLRERRAEVERKINETDRKMEEVRRKLKEVREERVTHTGPKGGKFHINSSGKKVYLKKERR